MSSQTCHNCGKMNEGTGHKCRFCGLTLMRDDLKKGDRVEWRSQRGREMRGSIAAVVPASESAANILRGIGIVISNRRTVDRVRPYRCFVVDIGGQAVRPALRHIIPNPFKLRKTGCGNGSP